MVPKVEGLIPFSRPTYRVRFNDWAFYIPVITLSGCTIMHMVFIKIDSTEPVTAYITEVITTALKAGKRVLWLLTGGSGMSICVDVSKRLRGMDLHNLMVSLTDERFGPVGHIDSNWKQLVDMGFEVEGAQIMPVLIGADCAETTQSFADTLRQLFEQSEYKLGIFGMGADGHTAGIKPGSPALTSMELASSFKGEDFERITMTPTAICMLDEAVLCARGEEKHQQLKNLEEVLPASEQPVQILKKVPKFTIFNDYKGDST